MKLLAVLFFFLNIVISNGCAKGHGTGNPSQETEENIQDMRNKETNSPSSQIVENSNDIPAQAKRFTSKTYKKPQPCSLDPTKSCLCEVVQEDSGKVIKYANHKKNYCAIPALHEIQNGYISTRTGQYVQGYSEKGYQCYFIETNELPEEENIESIDTMICNPLKLIHR